MTISEATNPEEEHNMTINDHNKITLNDAVFRLLETCYSIKQGKAIERIDNLLTNLYPIVFDFSITEPYKKEDNNNIWELKVVWRTSAVEYKAVDMWLERVEGGVQEHIEWATTTI